MSRRPNQHQQSNQLPCFFRGCVLRLRRTCTTRSQLHAPFHLCCSVLNKKMWFGRLSKSTGRLETPLTLFFHVEHFVSWSLYSICRCCVGCDASRPAKHSSQRGKTQLKCCPGRGANLSMNVHIVPPVFFLSRGTMVNRTHK